MLVRQRFWIDDNVQGVLIGRVILYWTIGVLYVVLGTTFFQYYQHPNWSFVRHIQALFTQFWPWMPSLILFVPLVIHDINKLSNLFVGPIYRLRMHLAELTANPECRELTFREDDYWQDLAGPINHLQIEILALRAELAEAKSQLAAKPQRGKVDLSLADAANSPGFLVNGLKNLPPLAGPAASLPPAPAVTPSLPPIGVASQD